MDIRNKLTDIPDIAKEWHPTKNGTLKPDDVTIHSNKKVWWMCKKGHEWQAIINNRSKGSKCPYCSGRLVTPDTCLANINPELVKEWHPTKNGNLTPYDVTACSHKKVWWMCEKGHEWQATIKNRHYDRKCPTCSSACQSSFQQVAFEYYLEKIFGKKVEDRIDVPVEDQSFESDIYINVDNRKPISIEYCGYYSHKDKEKYDQLKSDNLSRLCFFISIRELGLPKLEAKDFKIIELTKRSSNYSELDRVIKCTLNYLLENNYITTKDANLDINCKRDYTDIQSLLNYLDLKNSLETLKPELLSEYNYKKNKIAPTQLSVHSGKRVWWQCEEWHEWQATVYHRVQGTGCPYCSGKKVCSSNCLATVNPELAKQWHPTKNGNLNPNDVTPGYHKKVWWLCEKEHEWQATISHRASGENCPYCSGRLATPESSLSTLYPDLAKQWHHTKNGNLTPNDVKIKSNKKVWWQCEKGHEWQAVIYSRTSGKNCPYCSRKKASPTYCLAVINPELTKQWHTTKNGSLTPYDVTPGSHKKVWWLCPSGHEWQAEIKSRNHGVGCPYDAGKRPIN